MVYIFCAWMNLTLKCDLDGRSNTFSGMSFYQWFNYNLKRAGNNLYTKTFFRYISADNGIFCIQHR